MITQDSSANKKRRELTPEQRQRNAERLREARRREPERFKRYREAYIKRAAARLIEAEAVDRGGDRG